MTTDRVLRNLERIGADQVAQQIADEHGVFLSHALRLGNSPSFSRMRDHLWAVIRWSTGLSSTEIASVFACDHTTILYGVLRHEQRINGERP